MSAREKKLWLSALLVPLSVFCLLLVFGVVLSPQVSGLHVFSGWKDAVPYAAIAAAVALGRILLEVQEERRA